jgi:hypothetical protein
VALLLLPVALAASSLDDYRFGLAALEAESWAVAVEHLRLAAAARPEEKARLAKALFFRRYLPHYYLGMANFRMGDCPAALSAWQESERQGVITRFPEYEQLQAGREECRQRQSEAQRALVEAEETLARAANAGRRVRGLHAQMKPSQDAPDLALSQRLAEADRLLDVARQRLTNSVPESDTEEVETATRLATEALESYHRIEQDADRLREEDLRQRAELSSELRAAADKAADMLSAAGFLRPYPPLVGRTVEQLERLLARARHVNSVNPTREMVELKLGLEETGLQLAAQIAPPPANLKAAAEAFLAGRYEQTRELLEAVDSSAQRVAAQAHLLRAAALHAIYQRGGGVDAQLLAASESAVAACRELGIGGVPADLFSPRFVAFFEHSSPAVADSLRVEEP